MVQIQNSNSRITEENTDKSLVSLEFKCLKMSGYTNEIVCEEIKMKCGEVAKALGTIVAGTTDIKCNLCKEFVSKNGAKNPKNFVNHAANLNKFHTKESILKMCRDYLGETVSAGPMDTHVVKD